jgi:hypothetical protein
MVTDMRKARSETFRYRPRYNIPRGWQMYIYSFGGVYFDIPEVRSLINTVVASVAPDYYNALLRIVVNGDSAQKVACDHHISRRTMYYCERRYYQEMYRQLRRL